MPALIQELALALGFKKQSALQTPLVAADMWALSQTNRTIGYPNVIVETNEDDIGKGHTWATQSFKSHIDLSQPWDGRLSSQNAAMLGVFGLGHVVKSVAGTGFKYTCTPTDELTEGLEMPATTFLSEVRQGGSPLWDLALIGMCLEEFRIKFMSGPGRDNATMTSVWHGCGKYADPSTIVMPAITTEALLNSGGATVITIGGVDYITAKTFVSAEFGFKNNIRLASGFYPGSGTQNGANIRGRMRHGKREAFLQIIAEFENGSLELANYLAQSEVSATITVVGGVIGGGANHTINISCPRMVAKSAPIGETDGLITVQSDFAFMKDDDYGVLTMEVTTDQDDIGTSA